MSILGQRIHDRRIELGLSQEELAGRIGTNQRQISYYETSKNDPTGRVLKALARALSTSADWLLGLSDSAEPTSVNDLDRTEREIIMARRSGRPLEAVKIIVNG